MSAKITDICTLLSSKNFRYWLISSSVFYSVLTRLLDYCVINMKFLNKSYYNNQLKLVLINFKLCYYNFEIIF